MNSLSIFDLNKIAISLASKNDSKEILFLQKRAFVQEAEIDLNYNIVPIKQTYESLHAEFEKFTYLKAMVSSKIIGSVRAQLQANTCFIGRLIVEPVFQGNGLGSLLLKSIENHFKDVSRFELFTGENSIDNVSFYKKRGYNVFDRYLEASGVALLKFYKNNN